MKQDVETLQALAISFMQVCCIAKIIRQIQFTIVDRTSCYSHPLGTENFRSDSRTYMAARLVQFDCGQQRRF